MRTQNLRQEHAELLSLAGKLATLLNSPDNRSATATGLRETLVKMNAKLGLHLAMEDKDLYPNLMKSGQGEVAAVAKRFVEEMGGIGAAFKEYLKKYPTGAAIEANWEAFKTESGGILKVLGGRIEKEERDLRRDLADHRLF
jgi:hypothetical protein